MKNMFIFTSIYLKMIRNNRRSAIVLWLTPIFFLVGAAIIGTQQFKEESRTEQFKVAIVNEDQTFETQLVIQQLTESPHLKIFSTMEVDQATAESYLRDNEIAAIIHIPHDFSRDVAKGINTPVKVIGNAKRPLQSQLILHVLESAADFTSAAQSGINTVDYFMEIADFSKEEKRSQFKQNVLSFALHILGRGEIFETVEKQNLFQQSILIYYALSFYVLLIMIWSYMGILLLKTNMKRPIRLRMDAMGFLKVHSVFARMLVVFTLVIGSALLVAIPLCIWQGVADFYQLMVLIGATMLITLVFLSLFMLIEALFESEKLYSTVSLLVIIVSGIIGEHFIPTVYYPDWLEKLNAFSLNGWILKWIFSLHLDWSVYSSAQLGFYMFLFVIGCLLTVGIILQWDRKKV